MKSKSRAFITVVTALLATTLVTGCEERGTEASAPNGPTSTSSIDSAEAIPPSSMHASAVPSDEPRPSALRDKPLADALVGITRLVVRSPSTGATGIVSSDAAEIEAVLSALGPAQTLSHGFGAKCLTPTQLTFHGKADEVLGTVSFCERDRALQRGRFDGQGLTMVLVEVKDAAKLIAAIEKLGAID